MCVCVEYMCASVCGLWVCACGGPKKYKTSKVKGPCNPYMKELTGFYHTTNSGTNTGDPHKKYLPYFKTLRFLLFSISVCFHIRDKIYILKLFYETSYFNCSVRV